MWYLKAASLCSIEWFEKKLMVVSVVVALQNMAISRLHDFRIVSRSKKHTSVVFVCRIELYVVCIWFVCVLIRSDCVPSLSYTIKISSA
jgi:hypothetical protein